MLCRKVLTVPHLYVLPLAAPRNDYIDEDLPAEDEPNVSVRALASLIPSHKSRTPSSSQVSLLISVTPFLRLG